MLTWPAKDPNEVLDYSIDWLTEGYLQSSETILTSNWTIVTGDVVIGNSPGPSISGGITKVWLSGGTDGTACELLNQITTSNGRTADRRVKLRIRLK